MTTSASNELATLIHAVETADSKVGLVMAVRALATAKDARAIPTLIQVLGYNNPGAALAAVDGLVALGDQSVPMLLAQIDDYNYGARAWAIRALAMVGDPRALPVLLDTTRNDFALSVRRAAARGIGCMNWSKLSQADRDAAQAEVLETLLHTSTTDSEWVVRYAAVVGLQALAKALTPSGGGSCEQILVNLNTIATQDATPTVQARARLACEELSHTMSSASEL
jgi:phycocyanobilin lyase beta subunit